MKFILVLMVSFILGCSNSGGSSGEAGRTDEAGIPAAIIGVWENESIIIGGQTIKVDRPDKNNPYRERNSSDWMQLRIDDKNITFILTDFVFYSSSELPYKVVGKKIVTIDESDSSLSDFIVHEYSENKLTLGFTKNGESSGGALWVFKRINESGLASKIAQVINFKQNLIINIEQSGRSEIGLIKEIVGEPDYSKKGIRDTIGCYLNKDNSLVFSYYVFEVKEKSVEYGGNRDNVFFKIKELVPDLNRPMKTMTSKSAIEISTQIRKKSYDNTFSDCEHNVSREGAAVSIRSTCVSDKEKLMFNGNCLLQHKAW